MRRLVLIGLFSIFLIALFATVAFAATPTPQSDSMLVRGVVERLTSEAPQISPLNNQKVTKQTMLVRITSGQFKGKKVLITNTLGIDPAYDVHVYEGNSVVIQLDTKNGTITDAGIADHLREPQIYLTLAVFVGLLLIFGWTKGLKALASLVFTLGLIFGVLLPNLLKGVDPILLTIEVAVLATVVNTLIIGGFTRKSLAAICGTIFGLAIAGLFAMHIGKAAFLTGFSTEEGAMLLYLPSHIHLNIQGLLFSGIIIGTLGAVMDVGMSVASAVDEVKRANENLTAEELIKAGMNVGRDIMGIMANTLILAYTGSSILTLLLFMVFQDPLIKILNMDFIASEIVRALSGSIGMILVVPITAVCAGLFYSYQKKPKSQLIPEPVDKDEFMNNWSSRK